MSDAPKAGTVVEVVRAGLNLWKRETYAFKEWPGQVAAGASLPPKTETTDWLTGLAKGTNLRVQEVLFDAPWTQGRQEQGRYQALQATEISSGKSGFVWTIYAGQSYVRQAVSKAVMKTSPGALTKAHVRVDRSSGRPNIVGVDTTVIELPPADDYAEQPYTGPLPPETGLVVYLWSEEGVPLPKGAFIEFTSAGGLTIQRQLQSDGVLTLDDLAPGEYSLDLITRTITV